MTADEIQVDAVAAKIAAFSYRFSGESELQDRIENVLRVAFPDVVREWRVPGDERSRIDFYVSPLSVAVECKTAFSFNPLLRQVGRYLESDRVVGIVVVSSRSGARDLPAMIHGKPVRVVIVGGLF